MKKNNPYSIKSETNIDDLFRQLWKNKILILSLSILCMLLAFLHTLSKPQEFITKIIIKNPPPQLFETYNQFLTINPNFKFKINNNNNNSNLNLNNNNLDRHFSGEEFVFDFNLNLLSFDNLENFLEQSKEFDNFKEF